jgi:hypothetical protein
LSVAHSESTREFWPVQNGYFVPFQPNLDILSEESILFMEGVKTLGFQDPLFLRGSMVESSDPFHLSDVDLIVIQSLEDRHQRTHQLQTHTHRTLDIKWLSPAEFNNNLVQKALVTHRSIQIAGPEFPLTNLPADFDFSWEHWCTYFPSGIPRQLHSQDPFGLIFWKHVIRCFGVLSYMKNSERFTRDIDQCLHIAESYEFKITDDLRRFRTSLELGQTDTIDITHTIRLLQQEFDR